MQNQQASIVNGSFYAASHELDVLRMPTVLALNDACASGFFINPASQAVYAAEDSLPYQNGFEGKSLFLSSDNGVVVWSEVDGSMVRIEGKVKAYLIATSRGPILGFFAEFEGIMRFAAKIRCVDLLGVAPGNDSQARLSEYRDLLSAVRVSNIRTLH